MGTQPRREEIRGPDFAAFHVVFHAPRGTLRLAPGHTLYMCLRMLPHNGNAVHQIQHRYEVKVGVKIPVERMLLGDIAKRLACLPAGIWSVTISLLNCAL